MGDEVALVGTAILGPPIIEPTQLYKLYVTPQDFSSGIERQRQTLGKASQSKVIKDGVKQRIAKSFQPEIKRISNRLKVLHDTKNKTKEERDEEIKLKGELAGLKQEIKEEIKEKTENNPDVAKLKGPTDELNEANHVTSSFLLNNGDSAHSKLLDNLVRTTDETSEDKDFSRSLFAPAYGFIPGLTGFGK